MDESRLVPNLVIPYWFMYRMRQYVSLSPAEEVCGLLAGDSNGLVRRCYGIENILHRADRYKMEPKAQFKALMKIERSSYRLLAIYHSHPDGPPYPSETDLMEYFYPEAYSIIWSKQKDIWQCRMFSIDGKSYNEIAFRVIRHL